MTYPESPRRLIIAVCAIRFFLAQPSSLAQPANTPPALPAGTAANYTAPLTPAERFHSFVAHLFSAESVLRSAAGAAILQGTDTPHEWGQAGEGYGRRFASSYSQHIIRATLMYGSSSLLHEDNRYFRSGESGFWTRFKYAVASTIVARRDDGTRRLSYSRISSYVAVAFIARAWQPPSTRGPENAGSALGVALGSEAAFNVGREFLPKILRSRPPYQKPSPAPGPKRNRRGALSGTASVPERTSPSSLPIGASLDPRLVTHWPQRS